MEEEQYRVGVKTKLLLLVTVLFVLIAIATNIHTYNITLKNRNLKATAKTKEVTVTVTNKDYEATFVRGILSFDYYITVLLSSYTQRIEVSEVLYNEAEIGDNLIATLYINTNYKDLELE